MIDGGAWGAGLATFSGDRILEVFYPEPRLGAHDASRRASWAPRRPRTACRDQRTDDLRGVRLAPVTTVIDDLDAPPDGAADAYLRLHLLSHRLVSRTASTSTASSACCRTSPGRAPARSTPRT